jgi:hypothetical protein
MKPFCSNNVIAITMNALQIIQQKLKAPKSSYNAFGKYHYRNQEDILEAVKPLLQETNSTLTVADEIVEIGGSLFIKATATLKWTPTENRELTYSTTAYAMHAKEQKGMNEAQITGAASSYARKYALNGLFLIDDTKDADATNDGKKEKLDTKPEVKPEQKVETKKELPWLNKGTKDFEHIKTRLKEGYTLAEVEKNFRLSKEVKQLLQS